MSPPPDKQNRLRWLPAGVYLVLLLLAIPWYWGWFPEAALRLVWGMPLWSFVSIGVSAAVSIYTAWLLRRTWPHEELSGRDVEEGEQQ